MRRSNEQEQNDLFSNLPAPPAMTTLQLHHDELVDLIARLLREVVLSLSLIHISPAGL
jgi:hypothetical protein